VVVTLTSEQANKGGIIDIIIPVRTACPSCRGRGGAGFYHCMRCSGKGVISGELPVSLSIPPDMHRAPDKAISLDRFGIRNVVLDVQFRISGADGMPIG
jgi:hypothetical protein